MWDARSAASTRCSASCCSASASPPCFSTGNATARAAGCGLRAAARPGRGRGRGLLRWGESARAAQPRGCGRLRGLGKGGLGELGGACGPEVREGVGCVAVPLSWGRLSRDDSYLLFTCFLKPGAPASLLFRGVKSVGASQLETLQGRSSQLTKEGSRSPGGPDFRLTPLALSIGVSTHTHAQSCSRGARTHSLRVEGRARTHTHTFTAAVRAHTRTRAQSYSLSLHTCTQSYS